MKIFIKLILFVYLSQKSEATLRLLSVVFRHGDRTPDVSAYEAYPKDPYQNRTFFPIGGGGLTNNGKNRELDLGRFLRREYDKFLGSYYYPGVLDGRNTFIERTQMSLQLVYNGLYPPKGVQKWNQNMNWQPMPIRFLNQLDDVLLFPNQCPRYLKGLSRVTKSPKYQALLKKFYPLMYNLSVATGTPIESPVDLGYLYVSMIALTSMNLEPPEWTQGIFPNGELYDGYIANWDYMSFNDELKRLNGGMLLRKMTDDMSDACSGKLDKKRKVFLYSAHDTNVAAFLKALNVYEPQEIRFSSAVIIELHKENHRCIVKVKQYKGIVDDTTSESICKELKVPGFNTGYLSDFKNVLQNHIATDDDISSCDKRSVPQLLEKYRNIPNTLTVSIVEEIAAEQKLKGKLM